MQNFFREKSDKDPLSIIALYAQKNTVKTFVSPQRVPLSGQKRPSGGAGKGRDQQSEDSIYTESFEDDKSARQSLSHQDIEEEILDGSKGQSSDYGSKKPTHHLIKSTSYAESIQEDYLTSMRSRRSPDKFGEDSIAEESQLVQASAGKRSNNSRHSVIEESINERGSDYGDDKFDSYNGSKLKLSKLQMDEHKKQVSDFNAKLAAD